MDCLSASLRTKTQTVVLLYSACHIHPNVYVALFRVLWPHVPSSAACLVAVVNRAGKGKGYKIKTMTLQEINILEICGNVFFKTIRIQIPSTCILEYIENISKFWIFGRNLPNTKIVCFITSSSVISLLILTLRSLFGSWYKQTRNQCSPSCDRNFSGVRPLSCYPATC